MKRIISFVGCLILFFCCRLSAVRAENITTFDTKLTVASDSAMYAEEHILYDFGTLEKHGIYRTIPYIKTNADNKKYKMTIDTFVVTDGNGVPYPTAITTKDSDVNIRIGDANKTISGTHEYDIGYRVLGAFVPFSDHDELYWNITGNAWEVPIEETRATVLLPFAPAKEDVSLACFTGVSGSTTSTGCQITYADGVVTALTTQPLYAGEGLTIVVGFPKGLMTITEAKKVNTWFADTLAVCLGILLSVLGFIWYIGLPIWIMVRWYRVGRDPKGTVGKAHVWFDVPKLPSGRTLTPGETGTVVDETVDMKDITATIIDLARRGYLKIIEEKKNDFYLERLRQSIRGDVLRPFERTFLDGVFPAAKTKIRIKDEDMSSLVQKMKDQLYTGVVSDGLFPKNPQKIRTLYYIIAGFALCTGNIPLAVIAFFFGRNMPRKTTAGADCATVAGALKGFIVSQDRQFAFQAKKQLFFEKFLPYAIVFGVETIWAERFKDLKMVKPSWYDTYDTHPFNSIMFMHTVNRSFTSSVVSSATPTRSSSGFSSGFSHGGGFSGGGGGGGGGGSW